MTKERRNEIAFIVLQYKYRKEGFRIKGDMSTEAGLIASDAGLNVEEFKEFFQNFLTGIINDAYK